MRDSIEAHKAPLFGVGIWPALSEEWPRTRALERLGRGLVAIIGIFWAVRTLLVSSGFEKRGTGFAVAGLVALGSLTSLNRRRDNFTLVVFGLSCLVALLWSARELGAIQGSHLFVLCWFVATIAPSARGICVVATCLVVNTLVRGALYGWTSFLAGVDESVFSAGAGLAAAFIRQAGIIAVRNADTSFRIRREKELSERFRREDLAAVARTREIMHDEVIGLLNYIGSNLIFDTVIVQREAAKVALILDGGSSAEIVPGADMRELLNGLALQSPLEIEIDCDPSLEKGEVIRDSHIGVIRRAVGEALRNSAKHAHVPRASVRASFRDGSYFLEITDSGIGFDATQPLGWGLIHSVHEPVESIGGRVTMTSVLGSGTTVTLELPQDSLGSPSIRGLQGSYFDTRDAASSSTNVVLRVLSFMPFIHFWIALRFSIGSPRGTWKVCLAATTLMTVFLLTQLMKKRPPRTHELSLFSMLLGAEMATGLYVAGPGSFATFDSWIVGLVAVGLMTVVFFATWKIALVFIGPSVTAFLIMAIRDPLVKSIVDVLSALGVLVLTTMAAWACGAALRATSRSIAKEARMSAEISGRTYRYLATHRTQLSLSSFTRREVTVWLRRCSELPDLVLRTEEFRQLALNMARQVRDELYLGDVLDDVLRQRILLRRRTGTEIVFQARDGVALAQAAFPLRILDRLLDLQSPIERILIGVPTALDGSWSISLVPTQARETVEHGLGGVLGSADFSWKESPFATTLHGWI